MTLNLCIYLSLHSSLYVANFEVCKLSDSMSPVWIFFTFPGVLKKYVYNSKWF